MGYDIPDVRDLNKTFDIRDGIPDGGIVLGTSSSSKNQTGFTSTSGGTQAAMPHIGAAPAAPDLSSLTGILGRVQRGDQIRAAMKDYDALYASTQAEGFQAAEGAGNQYASRLMQAGINPTSTGAVKAQARLGVYKNLDEITKEKSATRLDAINKSQSLQAQIAAQIASIRQSYSATLADFNLKSAGLELNLNEFNAGQRNQVISRNQQQSQFEAEMAARYASMGLGPDGRTPLVGKGKGGSKVTSFTPGYIGDMSPINGTTINGSLNPNQAYVGWPSEWTG